MGWLVLVPLLCCVAWRVMLAVHVGRDARQHGLTHQASLGWALVALADARRYWWGARLDLLTNDEAQTLLRRAAQTHEVTKVTNVRCPLCGHEIADVLTVSASGTLAIRPGANCSHCDFRLDACRHCHHFLPASATFADPLFSGGQGGDFTHGRCTRYREWQPVRETHPRLAHRLEAMGYESVRAPRRIQDSFFPPEECTSFTLDLKRLRRSEIPWLTRQRIGLVRLCERLSSRSPP